MFSHVVIWWTRPEIPEAADQLVAGAKEYLPAIPTVTACHIGKMVPSPRPVVDQSYQVAMYVAFADKQGHDEYQGHPLHVEFVAKLSHLWQRVTIYDFA